MARKSTKTLGMPIADTMDPGAMANTAAMTPANAQKAGKKAAAKKAGKKPAAKKATKKAKK